jgi:hypothetical protein
MAETPFAACGILGCVAVLAGDCAGNDVCCFMLKMLSGDVVGVVGLFICCCLLNGIHELATLGCCRMLSFDLNQRRHIE